jgi:predicted nucleotidyltransferase
MDAPVLRDKDLNILRMIFLKFPRVKEVLLFGSRATGHARRASDLDLAIVAPGLTAAEWADLCDALESASLIYELDVVRLDQLLPSALHERIEREGLVIHAN